jgi:hypothetical protein
VGSAARNPHRILMASDDLTPLLDVEVLRVPQHVVYRDFLAETVVLNLSTGKYHGLNRTAGQMLRVLDELGTIEATAVRLADEHSQPVEVVRGDLLEFCRDLLARNLIERVDGA